MKKAKKLLLFVLVCALAVPFLVACTVDEEAQSGTESWEDTSVDTGIPPEIVDFGGKEINVYCWDWESAIVSYTGEIIYEEDEKSATPVDVAKKKVIDRVQQEYNCTIGGIRFKDSSWGQQWMQTVQNMVQTQMYDFDILFNSSGAFTNMINADLLTDLYTVDTLRLDNPWWDQNAVKDLSIAHRLYYVCGDINTYDDLGTWCVLFNKTLKTNLGIEEDFYQLVKDHKWTLDKMIEVCQGVTRPLNGGAQDERGQWAFGTEMYNIFVQMLGGGIHVIEKDENDIPYFTIGNRRSETYSALSKIVEFYNSKEVMIANNPNGMYSSKYGDDVWYETVLRSFEEGRELFYMCGLIHVSQFRRMKDEMGILPIPLLYEGQESYHHTVSTGNSSYMAIPKGIELGQGKATLSELGSLIEAIAMYSREYVTPVFYDEQLKYRDARDDDSAEMLDLIFSTRSFDLGPIYNWGGIMSCYQNLDGNFESKFSTVLDNSGTSGQAWEKMNDTIDRFLMDG